MNYFNPVISVFRLLICSSAAVRSRRSCSSICGAWLLLLSPVTLSSMRLVTWASVGVLTIFGGAGVLSIISSEANFAWSLTQKESLLPFGSFSNVPFVVRKVVLFSTTCLSTLILLEHVYMRPEVNSNRFEISLRGKISLRCKVTSLFTFT